MNHHRRRSLGIAAAITLAIFSTLPAAAQTDEAPPESAPVDVRAVEYAFVGLPTSLPAGSSLGLTNDGVEFHELALARIGDDTTESLEELLAMEDPVGAGLVEIIGDLPLFARPGEAAEGSLPLEREGRYVAFCFIPQGLSDATMIDQMMSPDLDPATASAELQAIMANPPHMTLGMIQEFTVTAAGTEPGPLPEPLEEMSEEEPTAEESSVPEA